MKTFNTKFFRQPEYYVLTLAFLVVTAIITISLISSRSISFFQRSNLNTHNTYLVKEKIQLLLSDVLHMDAMQQDQVFAEQYVDPDVQRGSMDKVELDVTELNDLLDHQSALEYDQLSFFVKRKVKFSRLISGAFYSKGAADARGINSTGIGQQLTDSIYTYSRKLETRYSQEVQASLDDNLLRSRRLQPITNSLSIVSLIGIIALSWMILYRIQQKNKSLKLLRRAHKKELRARKALMRAKAAAESNARMKEHFLANMSHELRTPINAVIGFCNILRKSELGAEQDKYVSLIHNSGKSLLSLVNDILDLSKIEAGMMKLESVPTEIPAVAEQVVAMLGTQARDKGLELELEMSPAVPVLVLGDPLRLSQIITNLISNAIKFTSKGSVRLSINVISTNDTEQLLQFVVADTGIGMTEEQQRRVFQRFDQAEADTSRHYGGTGLGLSIVKELVELQNGTIWVESMKGVGSRFIFTIPFAGVQREEDLVEAPPQQLNLRKDARVLVVDDNEVNRMLLEYLLLDWGLKFELASNGKEALALLMEKSFDLALMDIQMPEMDGYTAIEKIRKELKSRMPVIAMTAHALNEEKEKCFRLGMNGYISKPFDEQELYRQLTIYIGDYPKSAHIDHSFLHRKFSGNTVFIKKIIEKAIEQFLVELDLLDKAIQAKYPEDVVEVAHSMRTTVAVFHQNPSMLEWLRDIETAAKAGEPVQWEMVEELLTKTRNATVELKQEARSFLERA